jgi:hypothetical protein
MSIDQILKRFCRRYKERGSFDFADGQALQTQAKGSGLKNGRGVYLIYGREKSSCEILLYIGKSGTMQQNGSFRKQQLLHRITSASRQLDKKRVTCRWYYVEKMKSGSCPIFGGNFGFSSRDISCIY